MERGEVWLAEVDGVVPVVLLTGATDVTGEREGRLSGGEAEFRGMQIVPAAAANCGWPCPRKGTSCARGRSR